MNLYEYRVIHDDRKHPILEMAHEYEYPFVPKENEDIVNMLNEIFHMNKLAEEYCYVVARNYNLDILGIYQLSHGNFRQTRIDLRELFIYLLLIGTEKFIIAHNHPNGNLIKSDGDINITNEIKKFSALVGIDFDEHFIISSEGYSQLLHQIPENKVVLWDNEEEMDYQYLITDDFAIEIIKIIEERATDSDSENEIVICGRQYYVEDNFLLEVKSMLDRQMKIQ